MRRFVKNTAGKKLTGSWSQGRHQKYPYYRFGGIGSNYNRDEFEKKFKEYMNRFVLSSSTFEKLKGYVKKNLSEAVKDDLKHSDYQKQCIADLNKKQSVLVKKNIDGVITDVLLKQELEIIEEELLNMNSELISLTTKYEVNYEKALAVAQEYIKNPGNIWAKSEIDKKLKLQWFQFPLGITFSENSFGTAEIPNIFKVKPVISGSHSSVVDHSNDITNNAEIIINNESIADKVFWENLMKDISELSEILKSD